MNNTVTFCTVYLIFIQLFKIVSTWFCEGYVDFSTLNYHFTNAFNSIMFGFFHIPFRINGPRCCSDYKWNPAQNKCIRMLFFFKTTNNFNILTL